MLRSIWACRFVPTRFPEPIALIDGREREGLRAKAHVDGLSRIRRWQCSRRSFFPLQACQRSGRKSWASKVRRHYIRRPFVDRVGSARAGGVLKDDADLSTLGLKDGMSLMLMVRTVLRRRRCPLSPPSVVRIRVQGTADQAAFEAAVKAPTAKVCDLHPRAVLRPGPWKANNVGCAFYRQIQFLEDMPEDMQIGMLVGLPSGLNNLGAFDCAS